MLTAFYDCCIYSSAPDFIMEANTMNPDQTASFGGPDLAHCFQFMLPKQHKRLIILIRNKMLNNEDFLML